ncbi:hypothetical protein HOLleu_09631 [Holothuria leucospilota]|uniref:exodeoxyribonuclease III n=1 Tax=Holothuria leucospilota TaxID=206669 RepID=A0A9Q1CD61_HOLLE|nr:hypothetical protein HOLleu_09631 [Holothuria leucospilota]
MIKFCTFNVNGLKDDLKRRRVLQFFKLFQFDIIFLQEFHFNCNVDVSKFQREWGRRVFVSTSPSAHFSGVGILFNPKFACTVSQCQRDREGRLISMLIHHAKSNSKIRLCNVYAPNVPSQRRVFFQNLSNFVHGPEPTLLAGDFNCIFHNDDRSGVSANTSCFIGREELQSFLSARSLVDAWVESSPHSPGHTWFHSGKGQSSRLDRIYVPPPLTRLIFLYIVFRFLTTTPWLCILPLKIFSQGKGVWKCSVSILEDTDFCNDFRIHYPLWSTLKPGYNSIVDWWEDCKEREKHSMIRHGVRLARERRDRLAELESKCISAGGAELAQILDDQRRGEPRFRSRERYLEHGEIEAFRFFLSSGKTLCRV